jgi:peptide/nickel transport system substrate-binding protein
MSRKSIFKKILFAFALAALIFIPSCSRDPGLRFGFPSEPLKLDPLNPSNSADGRIILFNVFEGLVKPGTDGRMNPCIAESWTLEQDGLIYNFILRDNVYFHDGSTVGSADVKFSLDTAKAAGYIGLDRIKDVSAPNDKQITVTLNAADKEFLPYMTVGIVKAGNNDRENKFIGTGPFSIERYRTQQDLVLKRFDKYWQNDLPKLDKVTIVFFENDNALLTALRGGSIDGAKLTGAMVAQLDPAKFGVFSSHSAAVQLLALNNAASPLDDIRVRQALNYGIDIQNIIDTAFFGMGIPSRSPIIPGLSAYYENSSFYQYNINTARSLLEQAGFGSSRALSLEITVPSNYTMHVDTAQVIVSQLEKIGVNASIKLVDWDTWISDVYLGRNYQATIVSLDSPIVSPRSFLSRYRTGDGGNFINFSNPAFDMAFDLSLTLTDERSIIDTYKIAQREAVQGAASVFIQDILYPVVLTKNVYAGVLSYPLYTVDFSSIYKLE